MLGEGVVTAAEKDRQRDTEGGGQKSRVLLPEVQPLRWGYTDGPLSPWSPGSPLHTGVVWPSLGETAITF